MAVARHTYGRSETEAEAETEEREQRGGKRRACGAKMCVCNVRASDVMSMRLSD